MFKTFSFLSLILLTIRLFASPPLTLGLNCQTTLRNEFEGQLYYTQENSGDVSAQLPQGIVINDPHTSFEDDFYIIFTYNLPPVHLPSGKASLTVSIFHKDALRSTSLGLIQLPFDATEFSMMGFIQTVKEPKWITVGCTIGKGE